MLINNNGLVDKDTLKVELVCWNEIEAEQIRKKYVKGSTIPVDGQMYELIEDVRPMMEEETYYTFDVHVKL